MLLWPGPNLRKNAEYRTWSTTTSTTNDDDVDDHDAESIRRYTARRKWAIFCAHHTK